MADSDQTKLDRVQAAIAAIENNGQDVTYNGKRVTKADLKTLYDRESYLESKIARAELGGIRVRRGTPE